MALESVPLKLSPRGITTIVVLSILLALATICMILRLCVGYSHRKRFISSDWLVLISLMIYYGHVTDVIMLCAVGGLGWHIDDLEPAYATNNLKLCIGQQSAYGLELGLIKIGVLLMLIQIFETPRFRAIALTMIAICACWMILTTMIGFISCQPLKHYWDPEGPGHCLNISAAWTSIGAIDVVTDALIYVMPIPMLWKLQMPKWKKWSVSGLFGLGAVTIGLGIARTIGVAHLAPADFTYSYYSIVFLSAAQPATAIIVVCCMTFRPLFAQASISLKGSLRSVSTLLFRNRGSSNQSSATDSDTEKVDVAPKASAKNGHEAHIQHTFAGFNVGKGMLSLLESQIETGNKTEDDWGSCCDESQGST